MPRHVFGLPESDLWCVTGMILGPDGGLAALVMPFLSRPAAEAASCHPAVDRLLAATWRICSRPSSPNTSAGTPNAPRRPEGSCICGSGTVGGGDRRRAPHLRAPSAAPLPSGRRDRGRMDQAPSAGEMPPGTRPAAPRQADRGRGGAALGLRQSRPFQPGVPRRVRQSPREWQTLVDPTGASLRSGVSWLLPPTCPRLSAAARRYLPGRLGSTRWMGCERSPNSRKFHRKKSGTTIFEKCGDGGVVSVGAEAAVHAIESSSGTC